MAERLVVVEQFDNLGAPLFSAAGGTFVRSATGGVTIACSGFSGTTASISPYPGYEGPAGASGLHVLNSAQWTTNGSVKFEALVKTAASIANMAIYAGMKLTNTHVIATDNDQAYFYFDSYIHTDWQLITSRAGVDLVKGCHRVPAVAASTLYKLVLEIDADRKVNAWINDVQVVETLPALTNAVALKPFVGEYAYENAAKSLDIKKVTVSRLYA